MLEIILIIYLCSALGKVIRKKGRKPLVFQILLFFSWFVGEIGGFIVGSVIQTVRNGGMQPDGFDFTLYFFGLAGAACATAFWFGVAHLMPPVEPAYQSAGAAADPIIGPPPELSFRATPAKDTPE